MIMNKFNEIVENYFKRSIDSYHSCIQNEENRYLFREIGLSHRDVQPKKDAIKILYNDSRSAYYVIEVRLNLWSKQLNVGHYILVLDEENQALDDYLVFI